MITAAILTIPIVIFPLLISSPTRDCQFGRTGDPAADEQALARFELTVKEYVDLHRRLERAWPPLWFVGDPEQRESAAQEFRMVLRDARPQGRQGNFFTADVADVFRFRIATIIRERTCDIAAMTASTNEEGPSPGWWKPVVNEPLPFGAFGATCPIFENLPSLPPELEYRLVERDLVLLDVDADMVLDVLDVALPAAVAPITTQPSERDEVEEAAYSHAETVGPPAEEFIGCLYGEGLGESNDPAKSKIPEH